MKKRLRIYLDSNVIIIGRKFEKSNSRLILEACEKNLVSPIISEDTVEEVVEFFKRSIGRIEAALARYYMLRILKAEVVWKHMYGDNVKLYLSSIRDPDDAPHLAAALKARVDLLVSTNRHFLKGIKRVEVLTPREVVKKIGLKPYDTYF